MKKFFSLCLIAIASFMASVVAYIKVFALSIKTTIDHSGYKVFSIGTVKSKATEAKAWLNAFLSRFTRAPGIAY